MYDDDTSKPELALCPSCGMKLECTGCGDYRPKASDLAEGWLLRSPLERVEHVTRVDQMETRVDQMDTYGRMLVYTMEAGRRPWLYFRSENVSAVAPLFTFRGSPELRATEHPWRDGPMHVIATVDTILRPKISMSNTMAVAEYYKTPNSNGDKGWNVSYRPDATGALVGTWHESKTKARTKLRAAGREIAKQLGIPFRIGDGGRL